MRGFLKFVAMAAIATACASPGVAAGFSGAGPSGFSGGAPNFGDSGPVPPSQGGDRAGPRGPSGPSHAPGSVHPPNPGGPKLGFRPPLRRAPSSYAGHGHDGADYRRRPRHYWLGGGQIFVPDPSGDYVYSDDDDDDGSDPTGCWVYRKVYDTAGAFLGHVHVDLCQGQ